MRQKFSVQNLKNNEQRKNRKLSSKMNTHRQTSVLQVSIRPPNISLALPMHPSYVVYQQMPLSHLFQHIQALYQNRQDAKNNKK